MLMVFGCAKVQISRVAAMFFLIISFRGIKPQPDTQHSLKECYAINKWSIAVKMHTDSGVSD